jgi:hypothetical protein
MRWRASWQEMESILSAGLEWQTLRTENQELATKNQNQRRRTRVSAQHQLTRSQLRSFFLNELPGSLDMPLSSIRLSNTNPQRQPVV